MTLKARPAHVSESNEPEVEQSLRREASAARIHVPEALPSHRERDEGYPTVGQAQRHGSGHRMQRRPSMDSATSIRPTSGRGWPIVEPELRCFGKPLDC